MTKTILLTKSMTAVLAGTVLAGTMSFSTAVTAADPAACNPEVKSALLEASRTGAQRATGIITNPSSGISLPKSVFDLGCLDDLYNLRNVNILFDPNSVINGLINQVKQRICNAAKDYYTKTVSMPFDEAVFNANIPSIPGLETSFPTTYEPTLPEVTIIPPQVPGGSGADGSGTGVPDTGSPFEFYKDFF